MQTATNEPDLTGLSVNIIVKPGRISSGWEKGDDEGIWLLRFVGAFLHPIGNRPTVRWVAKYSPPSPVLKESVLLLRIVVGAFVIDIGGTRIEVEMELRIQSHICRRRSGPLNIST